MVTRTLTICKFRSKKYAIDKFVNGYRFPSFSFSHCQITYFKIFLSQKHLCSTRSCKATNITKCYINIQAEQSHLG